jgi:hypothetical protein
MLLARLYLDLASTQVFLLTQIGIAAFGEYLSLLSPQVSKGFVSVSLASTPNYKVMDDKSNALRVMNTCKYHTNYCTGTLKQYDNEAA